MEQMLLTLDFIHQRNIVHRDLKPSNILIKQIEEDSKCEIRVSDLGLATFILREETLYHRCGTLGYMAPEIIENNGYSYKADLFSLGATFYSLLTGRSLFSSTN